MAPETKSSATSFLLSFSQGSWSLSGPQAECGNLCLLYRSIAKVTLDSLQGSGSPDSAWKRGRVPVGGFHERHWRAAKALAQ